MVKVFGLGGGRRGWSGSEDVGLGGGFGLGAARMPSPHPYSIGQCAPVSE
jgi:hypothetical protein